MKGIEISKKYFYEFGLPLLEKDFPDLFLGRINTKSFFWGEGNPLG